MLRIRNAQLDVLRADRVARALVPAILERLREADILPVEGAEDPAPEDDPAPTPEELTAAVHEDIVAAMSFGIESEDGILQYVSYRFLLDGDWRRLPGAADALSRQGLPEEARLAALHRAVSGG